MALCEMHVILLDLNLKSHHVEEAQRNFRKVMRRAAFRQAGNLGFTIEQVGDNHEGIVHLFYHLQPPKADKKKFRRPKFQWF